MMLHPAVSEADECEALSSPVSQERRQTYPTQATSPTDANQAATVEADISRFLRFSPQLERQFLTDTAAQRTKLVLRRSPVVMLTFVGMLTADWFMIPDRFQVALVVRTLAFIPFLLLTLHLFVRLSATSSRDWLLTGSGVLTAMLNLLLIVPSNSPLAFSYLATLSLMVGCWDSIFRPGFLPALAHCTMVMAGFCLAIAMMPEHGGELATPIFVLLLSSMVFSLYGNYTLERSERAAYLQRLNQNLLRTKLGSVNDRLSRQARLDPLTGLPNRRHFDESLTKIVRAQSERIQGPQSEISVILLDVDFFKPYNDNYGHPAGDRCLQALAQALSQCVRQPEDVVARIGGEEFAVVLSNAPNQRGIEVAERIRSTLKALGLPHGFRPDGDSTVSISIGLATGTPTDQHSMQSLISEADRALYRAKSLGRNRMDNCGIVSHA